MLDEGLGFLLFCSSDEDSLQVMAIGAGQTATEKRRRFPFMIGTVVDLRLQGSAPRLVKAMIDITLRLKRMNAWLGVYLQCLTFGKR